MTINFLKVLCAFMVVLHKIFSASVKKENNSTRNNSNQMFKGEIMYSIWSIYQVPCHTCDASRWIGTKEIFYYEYYEKYKGLILLKSELEPS